jgi:hypothetical protein
MLIRYLFYLGCPTLLLCLFLFNNGRKKQEHGTVYDFKQHCIGCCCTIIICHSERDNVRACSQI